MKALYGVLVLLLLCTGVPAVAADEAYVWDHQWGSEGTGNGQFHYPTGVALDTAGYAYVTDGMNRIQKFVAATGQYTLQWGASGTGPGQFNGPNDVAVSSSGDVYVVETMNHRVQQFTSTGGYVRQWGSEGGADGQFQSPYGIALDAAGNVYVADTYNYRVQKFSSTGTFLAKWGFQGTGNGQFQAPTDVAVDGAGNVWVVDYGNNRVQKFSSTGTYFAQFGSAGTGDGQFDSPQSIAVDGTGNCYVVDWDNNRVQKFTPNGVYVTRWGYSGIGSGLFDHPWGIAVDAAGSVYVTDNANHRVQVFRRGLIPGYSVSPSAGYPPLAVQFIDRTEGGATAWHWDFGDGTYSTERNPLHVYQSAGTYAFTLIVSSPEVPGAYYIGPGNIRVYPLSNGLALFQAEDYNDGGEGVAYHDTTPGNSGGWYRFDGVDIMQIATDKYAVTDTFEGEWTQYSVTSYRNRNFTYPLSLRVKASAPGRSIEVRVNGQTATTLNARYTPGFTWANTTVTLAPGNNQVRFVHHETTHGIDLDFDYFAIDPDGGVLPVPGAGGPPTDLDRDGWFVDVNGNYRSDFADVVLYFNQMTWIAANEPVSLFDYNANGRVDFADVVWLFNHL